MNISRDGALIMVLKNGLNLQKLSPEMQDDYEIVMTAVVGCGASIQYASDRLRDNYDIALLAMNDDNQSFVYISPRLQEDHNIIMTIISMGYGSVFKKVKPKCFDDYDFMMKLVEKGPIFLHDMNAKLLADRNFILKIFSGEHGHMYSYSELGRIDKKLLNDYEILFHMSLRYSLGEHLPDNLRKVKDLSEWLKSQLDVKKGNGLQLYFNDYDILISFF